MSVELAVKALAKSKAEVTRLEGEKERRVYWQGLAYQGMSLVDSILRNKMAFGDGTTEDTFRADCRKAIEMVDGLQESAAARKAYDDRVPDPRLGKFFAAECYGGCQYLKVTRLEDERDEARDVAKQILDDFRNVAGFVPNCVYEQHPWLEDE